MLLPNSLIASRVKAYRTLLKLKPSLTVLLRPVIDGKVVVACDVVVVIELLVQTANFKLRVTVDAFTLGAVRREGAAADCMCSTSRVNGEH